MARAFSPERVLSLAVLALCGAAAHAVPPDASAHQTPKVLILGGGVAGIIAARTLHEHGIDNFVIVEARDELGGRMRSTTFAGSTIELGANWIQGTQTGNGPKNPILALAEKHGVKTQFNDLFGSITTYDTSGAVNYTDTFDSASDAFDALTVVAGERIAKNLVDTSARTGYSLVGEKPKTPHELVSEYYLFDWEYAQTPEQSSWLASAFNNNFTFVADQGGFSEDNLLAIDQRGFKTLIQKEAEEFLSPNQILLNTTVTDIAYSTKGVNVTLSSGESLAADYALCTFSLGVLQNDDVRFTPALPAFKQEAIQSMAMAVYTKLFLHFPAKFWFDTEMGLYADPQRGRYPVWQSLDHAAFLPGSRILFATVTGDFARRIEALPDAQVQAEALSVLRAMFPRAAVPDPDAFFFPRWASDPLYRGTYANWPASFAPAHLANLRATLGRLWFAGEATSLRYFGFLHGAYFEGRDAGAALAACIRGRGCAGRGHVADVTAAQPYDI